MSRWWEAIEDDDPISLEPISEMAYPPFVLRASGGAGETAGAGGGDARCETLAPRAGVGVDLVGAHDGAVLVGHLARDRVGVGVLGQRVGEDVHTEEDAEHEDEADGHADDELDELARLLQCRAGSRAGRSRATRYPSPSPSPPARSRHSRILHRLPRIHTRR